MNSVPTVIPSSVLPRSRTPGSHNLPIFHGSRSSLSRNDRFQHQRIPPIIRRVLRIMTRLFPQVNNLAPVFHFVSVLLPASSHNSLHDSGECHNDLYFEPFSPTKSLCTRTPAWYPNIRLPGFALERWMRLLAPMVWFSMLHWWRIWFTRIKSILPSKPFSFSPDASYHRLRNQYEIYPDHERAHT